MLHVRFVICLIKTRLIDWLTETGFTTNQKPESVNRIPHINERIYRAVSWPAFRAAARTRRVWGGRGGCTGWWGWSCRRWECARRRCRTWGRETAPRSTDISRRSWWPDCRAGATRYCARNSTCRSDNAYTCIWPRQASSRKMTVLAHPRAAHTLGHWVRREATQFVDYTQFTVFTR